MIDELFEDCCRIADSYDTNFMNVIDRYNSFEHKYKLEVINVPYKDLIKITESYFKTEAELKSKNAS